MPSASSKRESCEIQYAYTDDGVRYIAVRYKVVKLTSSHKLSIEDFTQFNNRAPKENTTVLEITKAAFGVFGFIP